MSDSDMQSQSRRFLPWGAFWCGTALLAFSSVVLGIGYFEASREAATTAGERNLGAGALMMMFIPPTLCLALAGLIGWLTALVSFVLQRYRKRA